MQRAVVEIEDPPASAQIIFTYDEGTDVYVERGDLVAGASSEGVRVIRSRADAESLILTLEGRGGRGYTLGVISPHNLGEVAGVQLKSNGAGRSQLVVNFQGAPKAYVRRELRIPFRRS